MSAAQDLARPVFRPLREADILAVLEIEHIAFTHPWTAGIFHDCLRMNYSCWALITDQGLSGYGIMSLTAGECHILNLCISPTAQQQGLGRYLLEHLLSLAREYGANPVLLEVRASNQIAIRLYESIGFCEVGVRKNYYPTARGREDALIFALELV